jgi:uncharacterized BrkB/YihY/UPF0761 family membrane protein
MNNPLIHFTRQFGFVVLMSLVPVALVAFLSIPYTLGHHPGESRAGNAVAVQHEAGDAG